MKVTGKWTMYEIEHNDNLFQGRGRIWEQVFDYGALEEYWDKELIDRLEQAVKEYEQNIDKST